MTFLSLLFLQLEKEEQIHSIDIGNEGSAFIEVLVGHSTSVKDQDFEVRLKVTSFKSIKQFKWHYLFLFLFIYYPVKFR